MPADSPGVVFAVTHTSKGMNRKMPAVEGPLEIAKTEKGMKDSRTS